MPLSYGHYRRKINHKIRPLMKVCNLLVYTLFSDHPGQNQMKTVVILDEEISSTHSMEAVLERRGFIVQRARTAEEALKFQESGNPPIDLVIAEAPVGNGASQTQAAIQIRRSSPDIPILLVSELSLDKWTDEDFLGFEQLLSGRIDLLVKPLSQASFVAKANALIYTVSYRESRRLFESAAAIRSARRVMNAATG